MMVSFHKYKATLGGINRKIADHTHRNSIELRYVDDLTIPA